MARNKVINKPQPACKYCSSAVVTADASVILCRRKGNVMPEDSCRRFKYDPLKRQPGSMPELGNFTYDQFVL